MAPIMIPMAWVNVINRALTKPMVITVVALLLWIIAVTRRRPYRHQRVSGDRRQDAAHAVTGGFQPFTHQVHPVNKQGQSAGNTEYDLSISTPTPAVFCLFLPVLRVYEQNTPGSFYSFPVGITLPMIDYGEKDCLYKENRKRQRKSRIFSHSFFVFLKRF